MSSKPDQSTKHSLTRDELCECAQAMNEVLHGFLVPEFEQRIGSRVDASRLLRHVIDVIRASRDDGQDVFVELDAPQTRILTNAIETVLGELDEGEFELRMACTVEHARELRGRLLTHCTLS